MARNKNQFLNKNKHIPYNFIWTKEKPISYITESYQKFLANLEYVNIDKKYKVIQTTSSITSEGKTTFQANVAFLLAQKKYKTILVDLDLRKPKVHKIYNVPNTEGVTEVLSDKVSLENAIKSDKKYGFDVLTSGEKTEAVINLIQSNKMTKMFDTLREKYDYILVDSPPIINVSDSLYISKVTDSVIFVISQKDTKRGVVKEALSLLNQNKINVIGAVVSQVDITKSRYGYGYGYGYGYNYSYEEESD